VDRVLGKKSSIAVFVLPGLLIFVAIMVVPILMSFSYSLTQWDGLNAQEFVGLNNFIALVRDNYDNFLVTVRNTSLIALLTILVQIPLGLILALVLANGIKGEGFFRTVYFTPVVVSATVVGQLFLKIYNPDYGLLNVILGKLGLASLQRAWLGDTTTALIALLIPIVWQYIGQQMLLFYAGIKSISSEILEAAEIDGANQWQRATKITIPLIAPMIEVCMTLGIVGSIKLFDLSFILTKNGEPLGTTRLQTGLMYKQIFEYGKYGMGSATAILIVLQCLLVTLLIQWLFKKRRL
jgi:raffinose/stachyose/melibiose transport system permease protein